MQIICQQVIYAMGVSMNCLAKYMGGIRRIAKEDILLGLCQEDLAFV